MNRPLTLVALATFLVSCDSENAIPNVSGTYSLNLKVTKLDCAMLPAAVGDESTGVQVVVTQDATDKKKLTAVVQGAAGVLLTLGLGSASFAGTVSGNTFDVLLEGRAKTEGTCAYSQNARLRATLDKDFLSGTLSYSYATNKGSDCGTKDTCVDEQSVTGARAATTH